MPDLTVVRPELVKELSCKSSPVNQFKEFIDYAKCLAFFSIFDFH